jgi:hypothetical protein
MILQMCGLLVKYWSSTGQVLVDIRKCAYAPPFSQLNVKLFSSVIIIYGFQVIGRLRQYASKSCSVAFLAPFPCIPPNFIKAIEFVNDVAKIAEMVNYHQIITIICGTVKLSDVDAITKREINVAKEIKKH